MSGHAVPWTRKKSGQQKEDETKARELQRKSADLMAQQEREITQRKKKLNAQQVAMLRSRFGVAGAAPSSAGDSGGLQPMSDTSSSLFARITGR